MIELQSNITTKPGNIEELFNILKTIVTYLYNKYAPEEIKQRPNIDQAKMTDIETICIFLLIRCLGLSESAGYSFLKKNFPGLVNYPDRSRFNRTIRNLTMLIRHLRLQFILERNIDLQQINITDGFPVPVAKFGRAHFSKLFRDISSYGYCASKKETYYGLKSHLITTIDGEPIDYLLTAANIDEREALIEHYQNNNFEGKITLADKGLTGQIKDTIGYEFNSRLIALQKDNSKTPLPKPLRNIVSKLRRRIETTIGQLVAMFNLETMKGRSKLSIQRDFEFSLFAVNSLVCINQFIGAEHKMQIASLVF